MVLDNPQPVTSPQRGYACLRGRNHTGAARCALTSSPSRPPASLPDPGEPHQTVLRVGVPSSFALDLL